MPNMQVENALLRTHLNLRILAYHAAISDDRRTANLQVWLRACANEAPADTFQCGALTCTAVGS